MLRQLLRVEPGSSDEHVRLRAGLEHAVMRSLQRGVRQAEALVARLASRDVPLELVDRGTGRRRWRALLPGSRLLEINATSNRGLATTWIHYEKLREPPRLSPRQANIDALQKAFYTRHADIARRARAKPAKRISPQERTLLLVGDFEAGINNGGFSTYLSNHGSRGAKAALEALKKIGAHKSASMLREAMRPGAAAGTLDRLDSRFNKGGEDVAVLAARHAGLEHE
jgi:hypothetical protein